MLLNSKGWRTQSKCNPTGLPAALQEKSPDYDSYCMLAEAYMTLQEPDKAAAAFEVWQDLVAPEVTCTRRTFPAPLLTACVCVCDGLPLTVCASVAAEGLQLGGPGGQCLRGCTRLQPRHRPLQQVGVHQATCRLAAGCLHKSTAPQTRQSAAQGTNCNRLAATCTPWAGTGRSATTQASWGCSTCWPACC